MQHQKLFIMAIMIGSMVTNNCYAAESKAVVSNTMPKPIMLENGLLTFVPSLLVPIHEEGFIFKDYFMKDVKRGELSTLANLMGLHQHALASAHDGKINSFSSLIFYPTIVRIENNTLKNLGSFCSMLHKEAKEACRLKQAAFYPHKQGVILYSLDSNFNLDFFESKKNELEAMLDENAKKQMDLFLPVFANVK